MQPKDRLLVQLEEERTLLRAVVRQMPAAVVIAEAPAGRLLMVNDQMEQIFTRPLPKTDSIAAYAQYAGFRPDGRRYQPHDWPLARSITTGEVVTGEEIHLEVASGERRILIVNSAPIHTADGEIAAGVSAFFDMTAHKRAERDLLESRRVIQHILDTSPDVIIMFDLRRRRIGFANRQMSLHLGYSPQEIAALGEQSFAPILGPDGAASLAALYQRIGAAADGTVIESEFHVRRADGRWRWFACRTTVSARTPDGRPAETVSTATDVTERKEMAEALRRHADELEHLVAERTSQIRDLERQKAQGEKLAAAGQMAARVAHEINNPLAGIYNSFQLIKDAVTPEHPYHRYVARIEKEITRIGRIVRQMFHLYRPVTERPTCLDLAEVVRDVVALLEPASRARQVSIEHAFSPEHIRACVPEDSLRQVLFNLIQNAVDASPPTSTVSVTAALRERGVVIAVADRGAGIPAPVRAKVFEPFFTTKEGANSSGLGLGLSVARSLVLAMGGTLEFDTELGRGTTFLISLPAGKETADARQVPHSDRRR